jgi:multiple sugar transport system substrate-binding protein
MILEQLIQEFNKNHPDIKVRPSYFPGTGSGMHLEQKLLTAISGGTPPEVVLMDRFIVAGFAEKGVLMNLDDYFDQNNIKLDSFWPVCIEESQYKGHVWAIPLNTDVRALFYRIDAFREAGLDPDKPPRDWDELETYSDKLTKWDGNRLVRLGFAPYLGFGPNTGQGTIYIWGWLNGGEFMDKTGTKVTCNEPRIVEALEWMVKFFDKYGARSLGAFEQGFGQRAQDPLIMGKVAMRIGGDWDIAFLKKFGPNVEYKVAPIPPPRGKKTLTWSGGFAFVIPKDSKYTNESLEFIKFLTNREYQLRFGKGAWVIPALKEVTQDPFYQDSDKYGPFLKLMDVSKYRPVTPVARFYWDQLMKATDLALLHEKSPKQALDDVAKAVQAELDNMISSSPP